MLAPYYNLETIQSHALQVNLQSAALLALLLGADGELTPQLIIEQFAEFESSYQLLKSRVNAVQASLSAGHDPDRRLFLSR